MRRSKPYIDSAPEFLDKSATNWLVIGGGPSADAETVDLCLRMFEPITISTNAGIRFDPDYYFLSDIDACWDYSEQTHPSLPGSTLVTLKRNAMALKKRGLSHFDEFLKLEPAYANEQGEALPIRYIPGKFVSSGFSGLFCLQYAANWKPPKIIMLGMEGYDDQIGTWYQQMETQFHIEPFTQDLIEKCPGTEFLVFGELEYSLEAPNLNFMETYDDGESEADKAVETIPTGDDSRAG